MAKSRDFGSFLVFPELLEKLKKGNLIDLRLFDEKSLEAVDFRRMFEKISIEEIPESGNPKKRSRERRIFDAKNNIGKGVAFVEIIPLEDGDRLCPVSSNVIPSCALAEIVKVKILREGSWAS